MSFKSISGSDVKSSHHIRCVQMTQGQCDVWEYLWTRSHDVHKEVKPHVYISHSMIQEHCKQLSFDKGVSINGMLTKSTEKVTSVEAYEESLVAEIH